MPLFTFLDPCHSYEKQQINDISIFPPSKSLNEAESPSFLFNQTLSESDAHFELLKQKQVCDENGKELTDQQDDNKFHLPSCFNLDQNHPDDQKTIYSFVNKTQKSLEVVSRPPYKASTQTFSIHFTLEDLQTTLTKEGLLDKMEIVGSAAVRSSRNSLKHVFKNTLSLYFSEEELDSLWQSETIQRKIQKKGNDIDSRWHVNKASNKSDETKVIDLLNGIFSKMGEKTDLPILEYFFFAKSKNKSKKRQPPNKEDISKYVVRTFALEGYVEVFEKDNSLCLAGLQPTKGRPHDLTVVAKQLNACFFSRDCLRLLKKWDSEEAEWMFLLDVHPFNIKQYFIDLLTSNLSIHNMATITEQHWVRYLSYQTVEGDRFLEKGIEEQLVNHVFVNKEAYIMKRLLSNLSDVEYIEHLLSLHLRNHFALSKTTIDGEKAAIFLFHACQSLLSYSKFSEEQVIELFHTLDKNSFLVIENTEMTEALFIKQALLTYRLSFKDIQSHLYLKGQIFNPQPFKSHDGALFLDTPLSFTSSLFYLRLPAYTQIPDFTLLENERLSFIESFYTVGRLTEKQLATQPVEEELIFLSEQWLTSSLPLLNYLSLILHLQQPLEKIENLSLLFKPLQEVLESSLNESLKRTLMQAYIWVFKRKEMPLEDALISDELPLEKVLLTLQLVWIKYLANGDAKPIKDLKENSLLAAYSLYKQIFLSALQSHPTLFEEAGIQLYKALLPVYPAYAILHWQSLSRHCSMNVEKKCAFILFSQSIAYSSIKKKTALPFDLLFTSDSKLPYQLQLAEDDYIEEIGSFTLNMLQKESLTVKEPFFLNIRSPFSKALLVLIARLYTYKKNTCADSILNEVLTLHCNHAHYIEDLKTFFFHRIQTLLNNKELEALLILRKVKKEKLISEQDHLSFMCEITQLLLEQQKPSEFVLKCMQPLAKADLIYLIEEKLYSFLYSVVKQQKVDRPVLKIFNYYLNAFYLTNKEKVLNILTVLLESKANDGYSDEICTLLLQKEGRLFWQETPFYFSLIGFLKSHSCQTHTKEAIFLLLLQDVLFFAFLQKEESFTLEACALLTDALNQSHALLPLPFLKKLIKEQETRILTLLAPHPAILYTLLFSLHGKGIKIALHTVDTLRLVQWKLSLDSPITHKEAENIHYLLSCQTPEPLEKSEELYTLLHQVTLNCLELKKGKEALDVLKMCLTFPSKDDEIHLLFKCLVKENAEAITDLLLQNPGLKNVNRHWGNIILETLEYSFPSDVYSAEKKGDLLILLYEQNHNLPPHIKQSYSHDCLNALFQTNSKNWERILAVFKQFLPEDPGTWLKLMKGLYASESNHGNKKQKEQIWSLLRGLFEKEIVNQASIEQSEDWKECWKIALDYLISSHSEELLFFTHHASLMNILYPPISDSKHNGYKEFLIGLMQTSISTKRIPFSAIIETRQVLDSIEGFKLSPACFEIDFSLFKCLPKILKQEDGEIFYSSIFGRMLEHPSSLFSKDRWRQFFSVIDQVCKMSLIGYSFKLREDLGSLIQASYDKHQLNKETSTPFPLTQSILTLFIELEKFFFPLTVIHQGLVANTYSNLPINYLLELLQASRHIILDQYRELVGITISKCIVHPKISANERFLISKECMEFYFSFDKKAICGEKDILALCTLFETLAIYFLEEPLLLYQYAENLIYLIFSNIPQIESTNEDEYQVKYLENLLLKLRKLMLVDKDPSIYLVFEMNKGFAFDHYYAHLIEIIKRQKFTNIYHLEAIFSLLILSMKKLTSIENILKILELNIYLSPWDQFDYTTDTVSFTESTKRSYWIELCKAGKDLFEKSKKEYAYYQALQKEKLIEYTLYYYSPTEPEYRVVKEDKTLKADQRRDLTTKIITHCLDFNVSYPQEVASSLYKAIQILEWGQNDFLEKPQDLLIIYENLINISSLYAYECRDKENLYMHLMNTFKKLLQKPHLTKKVIEICPSIYYLFQKNLYKIISNSTQTLQTITKKIEQRQPIANPFIKTVEQEQCYIYNYLLQELLLLSLQSPILHKVCLPSQLKESIPYLFSLSILQDYRPLFLFNKLLLSYAVFYKTMGRIEEKKEIDDLLRSWPEKIKEMYYNQACQESLQAVFLNVVEDLVILYPFAKQELEAGEVFHAFRQTISNFMDSDSLFQFDLMNTFYYSQCFKHHPSSYENFLKFIVPHLKKNFTFADSSLKNTRQIDTLIHAFFPLNSEEKIQDGSAIIFNYIELLEKLYIQDEDPTLRQIIPVYVKKLLEKIAIYLSDSQPSLPLLSNNKVENYFYSSVLQEKIKEGISSQVLLLRERVQQFTVRWEQLIKE